MKILEDYFWFCAHYFIIAIMYFFIIISVYMITAITIYFIFNKFLLTETLIASFIMYFILCGRVIFNSYDRYLATGNFEV
jgi:hypothetical protein